MVQGIVLHIAFKVVIIPRRRVAQRVLKVNGQINVF